MIRGLLLLIFLYLGSSQWTFGQIDTSGFETFVMEDEDTSYIMKKYYLCLYKKGPNREQDEEESRRIQEGHLKNIQAMADQNILCIAGPLAENEKYRGVLVFSVKNKQTAIDWLKKDPAVASGRLTYELYPWWAAMGSKLY